MTMAKEEMIEDEMIESINAMVNHFPNWFLKLIIAFIPKRYIFLGIKICQIRAGLDKRLKELDDGKINGK
jgi:hypothetical protein